MPQEDILQKTAQPRKEAPKKSRISALGVIFTIVLAIALILLGERIIFDLNRVANPVVEKTTTSTTGSRSLGLSAGLSSESSGLTKSRIYYPTAQKGEYLTYKLLIHSAFIIPIFLLTFLFYFLFIVKKKYPHFNVVMYGYLVFAFWMLLHLLIELAYYITNQFPSSAVYIILTILVVIFTALAIFVQKKMAVSKD